MDKKPATNGQIAYITSLQLEQEVPAAVADGMRELWKAGGFTQAVASAYIDILKSLPEVAGARENHDSLLGIHRLGGRIYQLHRSAEGMLYVKVLGNRPDGSLGWLPFFHKAIFAHLGRKTLVSDREALNLRRGVAASRVR